MTDANPEIATLRTGTRVPQKVVQAVLVTIRTLREQDWTVLYEAVLLARDPGYQPAPESASALRTWSLTGGGGGMHDQTRAVLLAATEGDGEGMVVRSPYGDG
jgi:predicted alternative tryptophan synthase beta-subunit